MQKDSHQSHCTIEARSLSVVGLAGHAFWVLRDPQGHAVAELQGLATDRGNGDYLAIGTDTERYSLRAWHLIHDNQYAATLGVSTDPATFLKEHQPNRVVLSGAKDDVLARWSHAISAIPQLNALDLDYPSSGIQLFGKTVNSNSAYRTFGEIMDVPVEGFRGRIEPGLDNRMLPREEIERLRYRTDGSQPHHCQEGAPHVPATSTAVEHASRVLVPADSRHPDHRYFRVLRNALPAHVTGHGVAYAILKAKQDGVSDASQLDATRIATSDRTIFICGTTPGLRSRVDLADTPPTMADISTQLDRTNADIAQRQAIDLPRREKVLAYRSGP